MIVSYNCSWGPVSWLYMSEIFPSRIREIGIAGKSLSMLLEDSKSLTPCLSGYGYSMALQLCVLADYAARRQQHWLEDIPHVLHLQLVTRGIHVVCDQGGTSWPR